MNVTLRNCYDNGASIFCWAKGWCRIRQTSLRWFLHFLCFSVFLFFCICISDGARGWGSVGGGGGASCPSAALQWPSLRSATYKQVESRRHCRRILFLVNCLSFCLASSSFACLWTASVTFQMLYRQQVADNISSRNPSSCFKEISSSLTELEICEPG